MDGTAALSPDVVLTLALITTGVPGVVAIVVALIGWRSGRTVQSVNPPSIDLVAEQDAENARLGRENQRLSDALERADREITRLRTVDGEKP